MAAIFNPRFDSDADGINDVILWADMPGWVNLEAGDLLTAAYGLEDGDQFQHARSFFYQIRGRCFDLDTFALTAGKMRLAGVDWGSTHEAVIGTDPFFLGPGSDPTLAKLIEAPIMFSSPPPALLIEQGVLNGSALGGVARYERTQ